MSCSALLCLGSSAYQSPASRLSACPTKAHNSLSHNGGAGVFACESLVEILLPQAASRVLTRQLIG